VTPYAPGFHNIDNEINVWLEIWITNDTKNNNARLF